MIPGANILKKALSVISSQTVAYYKNTGRATNDAGLDVATFAAPVNVSGSVQAVNRAKYEFLGLDFEKSYIMAYLPIVGVIDIARDLSGDQMTYGGRRYQLISSTPWMVDGWSALLGVDIGAA